MKGLLGLIKQTTPSTAGGDNPDTFFFSSAFANQEVDASSMVPWETPYLRTTHRRTHGTRPGQQIHQ